MMLQKSTCYFFFSFLLIYVLLFSACQAKISSVHIRSDVVLFQGEFFTLNIEYEIENSDTQEGLEEAIKSASTTWSSSDVSVATVNENGTIQALQSGFTTISLVVNGDLRSSCRVTVLTPPDELSVTSVLNLVINADNPEPCAPIEAIINSPNSINVTLTYKTTDEKIALVDNYGIVKAVHPGECKIQTCAIFYTNSEEYTKECETLVIVQ